MNDFEAILRGTFRANPVYELVLYDRLAAGERELLADLRRDADFYGVLRPRVAAPAAGVKAVDRETALLLLTLREPGPLPAYVAGLFGHRAGRAVAQLVADGVLELAAGDGFVSGAGAIHLLSDGEPAEPARDGAGRELGALAALSRDALRYAEALPIDEPLRLSARLYGYHRRPLTPAWKRRLPDAAAVRRFLGIEGIASGGAGGAAFARRWAPLPPSPAWISWQGRGAARRLPAAGPMYKLYVSPRTEWVGESGSGGSGGPGFLAVAAALAGAGAPQFKVGADAAGLLRPDKIVAYFPDFEALAGAAELLREALAGVPAHGVPFTAEIAGGGLLSWGVDPPRGEGLPWAGHGQESWRLWLTHRLARALISARAASRPRQPRQPGSPESRSSGRRALALRHRAAAAGGGRHRRLDAGGAPLAGGLRWRSPTPCCCRPTSSSSPSPTSRRRCAASSAATRGTSPSPARACARRPASSTPSRPSCCASSSARRPSSRR